MVTGIEAAGVALAVLPLVINQLDSYARGIEKLKGLRRYKWQLEEYHTGLNAQYAIFLNTLQLSLEGVVDHNQRAELIRNPKGPGWQDEEFHNRLIRKLDRDYVAFIGTVNALCTLLESLSQRLGLEASSSSMAAFKVTLNALKARKIFSAAIYDDLLDKIDKTNQILRTLCEQSQAKAQIQSAKKHNSTYSMFSERDGENRRYSNTFLYDIMIADGRAWNCQLKHEHTIGALIATYPTHRHELGISNFRRRAHFHMLLSSSYENDLASEYRWYKAKLKVELTTNPLKSVDGMDSTSHPSEPKDAAYFVEMHDGKVKEPNIRSNRVASDLRVSDICSTLELVERVNSIERGHAVDGKRLQTYLARFHNGARLVSLQDTLAESPYSPESPQRRFGELTRHDRLHLATVLAWAIYDLHGTWLQGVWGMRDVKFIKSGELEESQFEYPYLIQEASNIQRMKSKVSVTEECHSTGKSWTYNEILLPLALALIQLSLGKVIDVLCPSPDIKPYEMEKCLDNAARYLPIVYRESGSHYGEVVKECLYWPRSKGESFEHPQFSRSVYETIVVPLRRDYDHFQGYDSYS